MRYAVITTSLIIMSLILLASFVYAETTFNDNPDEFMINPLVSAPASVQPTGGHGGRTADAAAPPAATTCAQDWVCGEWSSCGSGFQTRACADSNDCNNLHKQGNVSKVIAAQKPAESRDCKETSLPKAETPAQLAKAPVLPQKTSPQICGDAPVKLAISPIASAIAFLTIAIIVVKASLRKKGGYIIIYLHRDKHHNNKVYSDKLHSNKVHSNNFQSNKNQKKKQ